MHNYKSILTREKIAVLFFPKNTSDQSFSVGKEST